MSIEEWRSELFYLFKCCRNSPLWPKNFDDILEWQDYDAKEYLMSLRKLDGMGVFK